MIKTVLVTGCSRASGFGQRTAKQLAIAGYSVFAGLRNKSRADSLLSWAADNQVVINTLELDITDPNQNQQAIAEILERNGGLHAVVHNVGVSSFGALETLHDDHIRQTMETNFFGAADLTRQVLPVMREAGGGRIVFVTSVAGVTGVPGESMYCASKYAIEGLAQSLALEVRRFNIHVSTVRPGFFNTGMSGENTDASSFFENLDPYRAFNEMVIASTASGEEEGENPELVAQTIVDALNSEAPLPHYLPGEMAPALAAARQRMSDTEWQTFTMEQLSMTHWLATQSGGAGA